MLAWNTNVFVLRQIQSADGLWQSSKRLCDIPYHIECNDIFEGDVAGFVFLDEDLVNSHRAGSSWETEDKGMSRCRTKCLDPVWTFVRYGSDIAGYEDLPMMQWAMYDDAEVGSSLMISLMAFDLDC